MAPGLGLLLWGDGGRRLRGGALPAGSSDDQTANSGWRGSLGKAGGGGASGDTEGTWSPGDTVGVDGMVSTDGRSGSGRAGGPVGSTPVCKNTTVRKPRWRSTCTEKSSP